MIHGKKPTSLDDDLQDSYLFQVEMVSKWLETLVSLLTIGTLHNQLPHVVEWTRLYALLVVRLYQAQRNRVLSLCIESDEQQVYLQYVHITMGNVHFSQEQTMRRLKHFGLYWPQMQEDVHQWI